MSKVQQIKFQIMLCTAYWSVDSGSLFCVRV